MLLILKLLTQVKKIKVWIEDLMEKKKKFLKKKLLSLININIGYFLQDFPNLITQKLLSKAKLGIFLIIQIWRQLIWMITWKNKNKD